MILASVKAELLKLAGDTGTPPQAVSPTSAVEGAPPAPVSRPAVLDTNYALTGSHLDVVVTASTIVDAAGVLDRHGFFIEMVSGIDWLAEQKMEAVYDFSHTAETCRVVLRLKVDRANPEIPTISKIYPGAEWHEREAHDFFGIKFSGLADLTPLILPEDATFHPLRKDYQG